MSKVFNFEKDPDGRWYAIIPEWVGERAELEMVEGADFLLDILAQGAVFVQVKMTEDATIGYKTHLEAVEEESEGMRYFVTVYENNETLGFTAWLCHVTKFVFGYFPKNIYIL